MSVTPGFETSFVFIFLDRKPVNSKERSQGFDDHETEPKETPDPQTKKAALSAK